MTSYLSRNQKDAGCLARLLKSVVHESCADIETDCKERIKHTPTPILWMLTSEFIIDTDERWGQLDKSDEHMTLLCHVDTRKDVELSYGGLGNYSMYLYTILLRCSRSDSESSTRKTSAYEYYCVPNGFLYVHHSYCAKRCSLVAQLADTYPQAH